MSYLVANPEDRFSRDEAHLFSVSVSYFSPAFQLYLAMIREA